MTVNRATRRAATKKARKTTPRKRRITPELSVDQARTIYQMLDNIQIQGPAGKKHAANIQEALVNAGYVADE